MNPVRGVDGGALSFECSPSKGAIHYHILLSKSKDKGSIDICDTMQTLALGTNNTMKVINEFISRTFDLEIPGTTFPQCPSLHFKAK